ncbi:MAG: hypothetical protein ACI4I9_01890 [Porcipelethomonas sp.]
MKKKKVEGSVLYTVVSVMMIMTVFIFAALTMASAANKRAFNTYANNQTQYTARSVVDSICKALETNTDFSSSFSSLSKGSSKDVSINLPDDAMGKVVKATVTNIGNGNEFGFDSSKPVYKISAAVQMLGQENTVAMYVLADYEKHTSPFNYSLVSLDSSEITDNTQIFGGINTGVGSPHDIELTNAVELNGFFGCNGNITMDTAKMNFTAPGIGFYVNGNLSFKNSGQKIASEISGSVLYKELPYVYVEDVIDFCGIDGIKFGSETAPILIYAGAIHNYGGGSSGIYGDVYLLDEHKFENGIEQGVSTFYTSKNGKAGSLYSWTGNLVKKVEITEIENNTKHQVEYLGGNLYSKGKVCVSGSDTADNHIFANDVVASELELSVPKGTTINGSAVIQDELSITSGQKYEFKEGLFVDPDKFTMSASNTVINGKNSSEYLKSKVGEIYDTKWDCSANFDNCTSRNEVKINSAYFGVNGSNINNIKVAWNSKAKLKSIKSVIEIGSKKYEYDVNLNDSYSGIMEFIMPSDFLIENWSDFKINFNSAVKSSADETSNEITINSVTCTVNTIVYYIDSVEYIKAINDVAFANNGGTIYIDNIDQSVKIEMLDASDKVTADPAQFSQIRVSSVILPYENETAVSYVPDKTYSYENEYGQFLKDLVHNYSNFFPSSMSRENLAANKTVDNSFLDENISVTMLNNAKTSTDLYSSVNFNDKPVYYLDNGTLRTTYVNASNETICEKVPMNDESRAITESCTIIGSFQTAQTLYINPGDKVIWVRLVNFHGQANFKIIVDDSGTGKVNFFVPKSGEIINVYKASGDRVVVSPETAWCDPITTDGNFTVESSRIVTQSYEDWFNDENSIKLVQNPDISDENARKMIPNIYLYMDAEDNGSFNLMAKSVITGYVMAPTANFDKDGTPEEFNIEYDEVEYTSVKLGLIGAAVFKDISVSNPFGCVYINPGASSDSTPTLGGLGKFTVLYYQCY